MARWGFPRESAFLLLFQLQSRGEADACDGQGVWDIGNGDGGAEVTVRGLGGLLSINACDQRISGLANLAWPLVYVCSPACDEYHIRGADLSYKDMSCARRGGAPPEARGAGIEVFVVS